MKDLTQYNEKIFETIKRIDKNGGTMPEELPAPKKSLKEKEKKTKTNL